MGLTLTERVIGKGAKAKFEQDESYKEPTGWAKREVVMKTYKIEKSVRIEDQQERPYTQRKYHWDEMEVGDSFFVPDSLLSNGKVRRLKVSNNIPGKQFITKKWVENGVQGARAFRIK
jgi:hypothetical protein